MHDVILSSLIVYTEFLVFLEERFISVYHIIYIFYLSKHSLVVTFICMHMQEIRERLEPSHTKAAGGPRLFGPYFRIYVGNLPRNVDSYRLGQFFSKYGKVAEARVMCHIKTKRS